MSINGYARVSSREQNLSAQVAELRAAGAAVVFREKVSGETASNRTELRKAISRLESGDVLVVTRLDRLARSVRDLLHVLASISERGASFKSLKESWADTTTAHGRLFITILGGIAEFERELIAARCSEGIKRAKQRGVKFGRPSKLNAHQRAAALARLEDGDTQTDVARLFNVDPATISRLAARAAA
jgi:DNA invertase Pin-like site-specific DNA recombinase